MNSKWLTDREDTASYTSVLAVTLHPSSKSLKGKKERTVHRYTGTEALYRH